MLASRRRVLLVAISDKIWTEPVGGWVIQNTRDGQLQNLGGNVTKNLCSSTLNIVHCFETYGIVTSIMAITEWYFVFLI